MSSKRSDQDPPEVTFGPDWTVTPRVAADFLGVDRKRVHRLIESGVLHVQYEGRVRLVELDSLFAYRRSQPLPQRPAAHPDTDKEHPQHGH
ncbi:helix-turn-helix domain-containing protein [Streptomyces sp. AM6-12]|uniref:helix-turn-helix domain-containing protein n=1 Tax=Streptomyces sp. AM6-12 TaxID=3345149 RepID=UPI00378D1BB4